MPGKNPFTKAAGLSLSLAVQFVFLIFTFTELNAQTKLISGPAASEQFGIKVVKLPNGNYVVVDPNYGANDVGAVHLMDGKTHSIISTLTTTATNSHVGGGGIVVLANGNYVVLSPEWKNGVNYEAGAVTWCSAKTGLAGTITPWNSLVGAQHWIKAGSGGVTALSNGNYVVCSPEWYDNNAQPGLGAVTFCNGTTGTTGTIEASNSLIGSQPLSHVGSGGAYALKNGNYVVASPQWLDATLASVGAVTWIDGSTGLIDTVDEFNSLVGGSQGDMVGDTVVALMNGNYVVRSIEWKNPSSGVKAGAATWGDGTSGVSGKISSSNSLIGNMYDRIGFGGILPLPNGNYVVNSYVCSFNFGAVTWGDGSIGTKGLVSALNSLVGNNNDNIGSGGITVLNNGNFVISSPGWSNNGTNIGAGAVTWVNGSTGLSGTISASNSFVGNLANLAVGSGGVTALVNGNYVISTPDYVSSNGLHVGATTWANGSTGITNIITRANSLVGCGWPSVTPLTNGNYVVANANWSYPTQYQNGAATWCDGTKTTSDSVSRWNSLIGYDRDAVGAQVVPLANGHYVVNSPYWSNAGTKQVGAITWCDGTVKTSDTVDPSNSLIGATTDDLIGIDGITPLTNGNYVIGSSLWDDGVSVDVGAATFADGSQATSGIISIANSLVGSTADDQVGGSIRPIEEGHYLVISQYWDNGTLEDAGAVTWGNGSAGVNGRVTACNSVMSLVAGVFLSAEATYYDTSLDHLIVGKGHENSIAVFRPCGQKLASSNTSGTFVLSGSSAAPFVSGNCEIISSIQAAGANPVKGRITSSVYISTSAIVHNGQNLVRRHYDVNPLNNSNSATARITLYFSQADFDNYNIKNLAGVSLPVTATDFNAISALRVMQEHGTSLTGDPGSYSGWGGPGPGVVTIDPADSNIVWNTVDRRWEVSFDVTGFSGFFVYSDNKLAVKASQKSGVVRISPVPASDFIRIQTETNLIGSEASISDIQGRELYRFNLKNENRIDISNWAPGVYNLKSESGGVQRFIKQ